MKDPDLSLLWRVDFWKTTSHLNSGCKWLFSDLEKARFLLARLESAYSLIWGSHKILGKGGGDTLALLL